MALGRQKTPTCGKDTLPNMRVPQKILKKSVSLYYRAGLPPIVSISRVQRMTEVTGAPGWSFSSPALATQ